MPWLCLTVDKCYDTVRNWGAQALACSAVVVIAYAAGARQRNGASALSTILARARVANGLPRPGVGQNLWPHQYGEWLYGGSCRLTVELYSCRQCHMVVLM